VGSEISIERAVQFIKGGFAFRAGKELEIRAPLWQKEFSEVRILDTDTYARLREYIHNNPMTRRLTPEPEQYPYCSACRTYELDPPPQGLQRVREN